MLFSEIAVQNVAGFPPAARIPLRPGLNAFVAGQSDLLALLRALLIPTEGDAEALRGPTGPRKIALTITADDNTAYRLVRDLDGGRSLLKSDPVTRKAVKLSEDSAEITNLLQSLIGLPPELFLRHHFWLAAADLPSRQPKPPVVEAAPTGTSSDVISFTPEEARRRLPELQAELARAEQFEKAQDAVYELQQRLEVLSKQYGPLQEMADKIEQMGERLDDSARYLAAVKGAESRIRKFPEAIARREAALTALRQKREEYAAAMTELPGLAELFQDRMVLGGVLAGLLCLVGAFIAHMNALVALDIVPFGVAAFAAWRWVGDVEEADQTQRSMADLDDLEKRTRKQFEVEAGPVYAAMAAVGVNGPDELVAKLEEREMLDARRTALSREFELKRADPNVAAIEQQRSQLQAQLKSAETFVHGMGFTREAGIIRREAQAAEEAAVLLPPDPLATAVETAAAMSGVDPPTLLESFRDRTAQYLSALTDRRFIGVQAIAPGQCHVVAANGAAGPMDGLPPADRDLILVAVRVALAERVGAATRRPIVFDEPTLLVDPARAGLLVQMLKALAAQTQVIVRAFDAPPPGVVDHVASAATTVA
jgi:DNA repair exonuclease SbcCD ATPase subunit